jgi:peptidyl-prolyl cis-trans isomerase D
MISWMQKHNRYLVWTIWVATIAFIGAGFVGWGSYDFGGKSGNVAKVGDIEISKNKLNIAYSSIYNQYNEALQGQLDEKKAQEMGLAKIAFSRLATQAKLLNFAQEMGIVVSDAELLAKIQAIEGFQEQGAFSQTIYNNYLKAQRIKPKTFEASIKEEILIEKMINLLSVKALPLETKAISNTLNLSDKIAYSILTYDDLNFSATEEQIKSFWEMQKSNYMTPKRYDLAIVWTPSSGIEVSEEELKAYYESKSYNYTNDEGKSLSFAEAKELVSRDLKLKKSKKSAQKSYIAFKKGKKSADENITLALGDLKLTPALWELIETQKVGDILKPKAVGNSYATIKIQKVIPSVTKSYQEAREEAKSAYLQQAQKEALFELAEGKLNDFNASSGTTSEYLQLNKPAILPPLNGQQSKEFVEKLFTSSKEKGIISVSDTVVVYKLLAQKMEAMDSNETHMLEQTVDSLKRSTFEANLIDLLDKKYPTETYVNGLL